MPLLARRFLHWLMLAVLLACQAGHAEPSKYTVSIDAPRALRDLLQENLDIVKWQGNAFVDEEQLTRLQAAVPDDVGKLLATQGFFNPKVSVTRAGDALTVHVEAGEVTSIADVTLALQGPIRDEVDFRQRYAALLEVWPLPIGDTFSQAGWDNAKRRGLQSVLLDRYPAATLASSEALIDPKKNEAALSVVYESGPRVTLGVLQVVGLKKYPKHLVEQLAPFAPGAPYSQAKLLDFQSQLQSTPYFSNVFVDVAIDPEAPDLVPVRVEVTEAPTQKVGMGGGYSTDKGVRATLDYRHANLRDLGWIGTAKFDLEQLDPSIALGLQLPPDDGGYVQSLGYNYKRTDIEGQRSLLHTVNVQRTRKRNGIEVTQSLQFQHERVRASGEETARHALVPSQSWLRRDLDNLLAPREGTILQWQLGGAARGVLSTTSFVRAWGRGVLYWSLGSKGLLLVRGEAGQVVAENRTDVPSDLLFRAGGSGSVRGYDFQSLGLRNGDTVTGGRVLATASAEYQHRLFGNWSAATFIDAGGAADQWHDYRAFRGYGVGVRWASPVGPLALDVAYGEAEKRFRLHFSLGVSF